MAHRRALSTFALLVAGSVAVPTALIGGQASASEPVDAVGGMVAPPWKSTLIPAIVAAHVSAAGGTVMVVPAGPASPELEDVTSSLRSALIVSGTTERLLDSAALGPVAALDDAAIVKQAAAQPVERIVIVRVDTSDPQPYLVVTVYDKAGHAVGGFAASRGDTIAPPPDSTMQSLAVDAAVNSAAEDAEQAEQDYRRRRIVFDQSVLVTVNGNAAVAVGRLHPRTGSGEPLDGARFYRYINREDLAAKFKKRRAARIALGTTGAATAIAGLGLMIGYPLTLLRTREDCSDIPYDATAMFDACHDRNDATRKRALVVGLGGGAGLLVGGAILATVAAKIAPHPITGGQATHLAEEWNETLRKQLKLPKRRVEELRMAPAVGDGGGGIVISGRF